MSKTIKTALVVIILGGAAVLADARFGTFGGTAANALGIALGERVRPEGPLRDGVSTTMGGNPEGVSTTMDGNPEGVQTSMSGTPEGVASSAGADPDG